MEHDEHPTMEEQRIRQLGRQDYQRVDAAREQAYRDAFRHLYEEGVIETPPEEIPTRGQGLDFRDDLPDDLLQLMLNGRLVQFVRHAPHVPGALEKGWILFDPEPPYETFPPESAIASWEVTSHEE